jgi:hypothetical protein
VDSEGEYQFFVQGDDGLRLFVSGHLFIDEWRDQPSSMKEVRAKGHFTLTM